MHKSICIKTNKIEVLEYIIEYINNEFLSDKKEYLIYFSRNKFKIYQNIILHFVGEEKYLTNFYFYVSNILTDVILEFYEKIWINRLINTNYFYFDSKEKTNIINISHEILNSPDFAENTFTLEIDKFNLLNESIYEYISQHKIITLDGFVNFRIKNYVNLLEYVIDISVNKFLIEKEYLEFIDLIQYYIHTNDSRTDIVHLVYENKRAYLLDKDLNIIECNDELMNAIYLSDISFSTNDYALNALINLLPEVIYIHCTIEDEFIDTIKKIFTDRVVLEKLISLNK